MLPIGADQTEVNAVLVAVGLTMVEIEQLDPEALWTRFDHEIEDAYRGRNEDPEHFLATSLRLADVFIRELEKIPVLPEPVSAVRPSINRKEFLPGLFGKKKVAELA